MANTHKKTPSPLEVWRKTKKRVLAGLKITVLAQQQSNAALKVAWCLSTGKLSWRRVSSLNRVSDENETLKNAHSLEVGVTQNEIERNWRWKVTPSILGFARYRSLVERYIVWTVLLLPVVVYLLDRLGRGNG
jgi:hypothetical protein